MSAAKKLKDAAKFRFLNRENAKAFQLFSKSPELLSIEETENREKQWHGKVFEFRIIIAICKEIAQAMDPDSDENKLYENTVKIYDTYLSGNTDTFDIEFDRHFKGIAVPDSIKEKYGIGISVKFTQDKKSICMGDILSIYDHFNQVNWSLIVGFYSGNDTIKTPVKDKIYCFHVTPKYRKDFFGACERNTLQQYVDGIKSQATQQDATDYSKANKPILGLLSANPKIDSKKQRRCQCTINMTTFKVMLSNMKYFIFPKMEHAYLYESMKKRDVSTLKLNVAQDTPANASTNATKKNKRPISNKTPKKVKTTIKAAAEEPPSEEPPAEEH